MDWWLLFAVFLYVICATLIVAEVFIPSAGILGTLALVAGISGLTLFFHHSTAAGLVGLVVAIFMVPSLLFVAYKLLPRTRFGRRVLLTPPVRQRGEAITDAPELSQLPGRTGRVLTALRPVGMCDFGGRRVECVAESGYVPKDKEITAIRVDGTQVTVRVVERT
ncbi:MAG: serine protease [Planctomycetes bacterium]|nr:serine protease [Planctomycetota bacterium]